MTHLDLSQKRKLNAHKQTVILSIIVILLSFDFLIYFHLVDIIGMLFFPQNDNPFVAKLFALSVFALGYIARPLGALFIGRYGDIKGRKPALLSTIMISGLMFLLIACLPTYEKVGIIAPIIFVILRLSQGIVYGSLTPLIYVMTMENAPKSSFYLYSGIILACTMIGKPISDLFFSSFFNHFTQDMLLDYAWRIPFLINTAVSIFCLLLWRGLSETSTYVSYKKAIEMPLDPLNKPILINGFNSLFIAVLATFTTASLIIVVVLMLPSLVALTSGIDESLLKTANTLSILSMVVGCIFYGALADKMDTGKVFILGAVVLGIQAFIFNATLDHFGNDYVLVVYALLGFATGIIGLFPALMSQLFKTSSRLTYFAVTYNSVYAILGVLLPPGIFYVTNIISSAPFLFIIFIAVIVFLKGLYVNRRDFYTNLQEKVGAEQ